MKNYELAILNQWGEEEYCFFIESDKSEEEIMADYRQAIDVLGDKGYRLYIQERTFGSQLPSLQEMLEILGEADDDCEYELVHDPNDYEYTPEEAEMLGLVWDPILNMYI